MMTTKTKIDKINIEYLLTGKENGETILFAHGLGANLSQFENLLTPELTTTTFR